MTIMTILVKDSLVTEKKGESPVFMGENPDIWLRPAVSIMSKSSNDWRLLCFTWTAMLLNGICGLTNDYQ